jgi:transposase
MLTKLFFREVGGVRVDRVWWEGQTLHLAATTTRRAARCPVCNRHSKRVHSTYPRTIADLPCTGARLTVHLLARRFVCRVRWCRRKIFCERLPALVAPWGRRTARQRAEIERIGFALGGAPGARQATAAGLPVSRRTLLRVVRAAPCREAGRVRVLGVDDWSNRRGRTYGTILVNLETQEAIDLLPDRTAEALAAWLRQHPEVEIVSRDRGGAYADGARQGAPQARQVADRFHLLKNVTDSLERFLGRHHARLRQAAQEPDPPVETHEVGTEAETTETTKVEEAAPSPARRPPTRKEQEAQERHARRVARYEEVMAVRAQGHGIRATARLTGLNKRTVQRYVEADGVPACQPRARRHTQLQPFIPYLQERWEAGCRNAKQLWRDLRMHGFSGGYTTVSDYLRAWRPPRGRGAGAHRRGALPPAAASTTYTARQTLWLLLRPSADLTPDEQAYLTRLYHLCPHVYLAQALAQDFRTLLREHDVDGLYAWLRGAEICPIAELRRVAKGMWLDRHAIEAAVTLEWSNGQVEGRVNKLKVLKRSMYGRAKFDLLRQRVLHAA